MPEAQDMELVQEFARSHSEAAFTELVQRHIHLVYSVARRCAGNDGDAQDITQSVFVVLAQKAASLRPRTVLPGWLYETTRYVAARLIRSNTRRHAREQEAYMQSTLNQADAAVAWEKLSPHLESAMSELPERDRALLVLRFYQGKTAAETAALLDIREDAAHKRLARALEKMRKFFARHGVVLSTAAIAGAVSANSIQAAPAGLATIISTTALSGAATTTAAYLAITKTITMTLLQKTLVTVALAAAVGAGIYEAHQNARLRAQNQDLQQQQIPLAAQLNSLQAANQQLSNEVARAKDQRGISQAQLNELLKLRGQPGQNNTAVQELAKLRNSPSARSMPAFLTNAMAQGITTAESFRKKAALAKIARMADKLNLTADQQQAISTLMIQHIENSSQKLLAAMDAGQIPPLNPDISPNTQDTEIEALLTPAQLAAYPAYQQSEIQVAADSSAKASVSQMVGEMDLTPDQQAQAEAALVQLNLNQIASPNKDAIAQARASGDYASIINLQIDTQKQNLADQLTALNGILTPDQLQTYQQKQQDQLDMQANAMKMFLPPATNGVAQ